MYQTVNDAIDATEKISDISDDEILHLGYGIKYFGDYIPDPVKRARLSEMRARLEKLEAEKKAQRRVRRQDSQAKMCDCGHTSTFLMMTAHGTACPDCYDRMSD